MSRLLSFAAGCLLVLLDPVVPLRAEIRTLTDLQGRSVKADVISVENDIAKIKREDGRTFDLPLSQLTEEDQKALREWAKAQDSIIPAGAIEVVCGRTKFKSTKQPPEGVTQTRTDGTTEIVGTINRTDEDWGYSVTLTNRLSKPLKNVRVEYLLFVKPDQEPGNDKKAAKLARQSGSNRIALIEPRKQTMFKTTSMRTVKTEIRGNVTWEKTGGRGVVADTLHGIWVRIYVGDQLVTETSTPDTLAGKETW